MLFEDGICILCVLCACGLLWAYFAFLRARIVSVGEFVGGAVPPTVPEGGLSGIAMMGPVRLPSKR